MQLRGVVRGLWKIGNSLVRSGEGGKKGFRDWYLVKEGEKHKVSKGKNAICRLV